MVAVDAVVGVVVDVEVVGIEVDVVVAVDAVVGVVVDVEVVGIEVDVVDAQSHLVSIVHWQSVFEESPSIATIMSEDGVPDHPTVHWSVFEA